MATSNKTPSGSLLPSTNLLLISFLIIITSTLLLKVLQPKFSSHTVPTNGTIKKKAKLLKSIIQAQATASIDEHTKQERGRKTPTLSRNPSTLSLPNIDPARSTLAPPDSQHSSRSRSGSTSGALTPNPTSSDQESHPSETTLAKRKRDQKKAKPLQVPPTIPPMAASPIVPQIDATHGAATACNLPESTDSAVQTLLVARAVIDIDTLSESLSETSIPQDRSSVSISVTKENKPPTHDAEVQTSPSLLQLSPASVHEQDVSLSSSFRAAPSSTSHPLSSSPLLSPVPASPLSDSILTSDRPAPSPVLLNGFKPTVPNTNSSSSRRKRGQKLAAAIPGSPNGKVVVGMPKSPSSRDSDNDALLSPLVARRQSLVDRPPASPDKTLLALPRQRVGIPTTQTEKGKGRGPTQSSNAQYSSPSGSSSAFSPNVVPLSLPRSGPQLPPLNTASGPAGSGLYSPSPSSSYGMSHHFASISMAQDRNHPHASLGVGLPSAVHDRHLSRPDEEAYWKQQQALAQGWEMAAASAGRVVGLGVGMGAGGEEKHFAGAAGPGDVTASLRERSMTGEKSHLAPLVTNGLNLLNGPVSALEQQVAADSSTATRNPTPFLGPWPTQYNGVVPLTPGTEPPSTPITQSSWQATPSAASSQSRPPSRQSSLSVPLGNQHYQHQLQQQQHAYAFAHAQGLAQAQYQHALAFQQQQMVNGAIPNGMPGSASSNASNNYSMQAQRHPSSGWNSHPPSPLLNHQFSHSSLGQASPQNALFPVIYPYYVTGPQTMMSPTYFGAPTSPNPNGGRSSSNKGGRKGTPANGDKRGGTGVVLESTGWKIKLRTAEMEADRSGKELEIARWRLVVLEEDRIANEIENQEALAALASRAQRAEARLKVLDEARNADSSSNSGSGSPTTRPSSVNDLMESGAEPLSAMVDAKNFAPADGVKIHPLAWLDLDSITFSAQTSNARPSFLSSPITAQSRRVQPRPNRVFSNNSYYNSNEPSNYSGMKSRRNHNSRRRSTNGQQAQEWNDDEEEVLIVLDSPLRTRSSRGPSRASSLMIEEGDGSMVLEMDEDDSSFSTSGLVDVDASMIGFEEEDHEPASFIGSLPSFLGPFPKHLSPTVRRNKSSRASFSGEDEGELSIITLPSLTVARATPSPTDEPKFLQDLIVGTAVRSTVERAEYELIKRPASA